MRADSFRIPYLIIALWSSESGIVYQDHFTNLMFSFILTTILLKYGIKYVRRNCISITAGSVEGAMLLSWLRFSLKKKCYQIRKKQNMWDKGLQRVHP